MSGVSVAFRGGNYLVLPMAAGNRRGVALERGLHLLAAVGSLLDAEHEREEAAADLGDAGPDRLCVAGRVDARGVTDCHPADGDPGLRRHNAADVHRAAERDAACPAHLRAIEDPGTG